MTKRMTKLASVRLLLVDDHPAARVALRHSLEGLPRFQVVGEAGNIFDALDLLRTSNPHLAVIDIELDKVSGLMLAREVREDHPETRVLIWSHYDNAEYVAHARAAGARGYVLKSGSMEAIVKAIEVVADGGCYYSDGIDQGPATRPQLTTREIQILKLVARGLTSRQIANQLKKSVASSQPQERAASAPLRRRTVETHRHNIMTKLGAKSTAEMILIAIGIGLLVIHDFIE